jgi:L-arabinose isomerase
MTALPPLRVGLVAPRYTFFDPHMRPGFAERVRAGGPRCAALLAQWFDVVDPGVIETEADAARANEVLRAAQLDAVVYAPTMAVPAPLALRALEDLDAPLVLWNAVPVRQMGDDLSQAEATENTTTVACLMLANVLLRQGRPAPVCTTPTDDPAAVAEVARHVRAVAAAASLRGRTFLRLGDPLPSYLNVMTTDEELARLGVQEVSVQAAELDDAFTAASEDDADAILAELGALGWTGSGGPGARRSARLAHALRTLLDRHRAIGGTVNCHGPLLRFSPTVGIPACLAVAREAAAGRVLSCTGDQPAGLALHLARQLAGASLYHETYAPEPATGLMLIAAGGEGDPAWADPPGAVALEANDHYPGEHGEGTSIAFALRRGPATMLSLSPVGDTWHLAWATGEVVESRYRGMRGPNGMFRFDSGDAMACASAWIASGATHHNALAPGRLDLELPLVARALGIRDIRV